MALNIRHNIVKSTNIPFFQFEYDDPSDGITP